MTVQATPCKHGFFVAVAFGVLVTLALWITVLDSFLEQL